MLKMFVKHIIKTPTCFGHSCLTIFRGPLSVLSAGLNNKYNNMHGTKVKIVTFICTLPLLFLVLYILS